MPQELPSPRATRFVEPVNVSEAMNSTDPRAIFSVRGRLTNRIRFLNGLIAEGRGDMPSPGSERLTVTADLTSLYGQWNALNVRLAGFMPEASVLPYDPDGAASVVWNNDGTLKPEVRAFIDQLRDDRTKGVMISALSNMGEFSALTTAYLWATGRPKIEALKGPVVARSYEKVQKAVANAAAVLTGDMPNLRGKKYGLSTEEVKHARQDPRWTSDFNDAYQFAVDEGVIIVTEVVEPGVSKAEQQIRDLQEKIRAITAKDNKTPLDKMNVVKWNQQIMQLQGRRPENG